ncbi:hypothetical protein V1358_01880 [Pseudoalteromonas sp. YIC-656]|uniref:hypothetical protein n=1 Tax=Pseudoalteromonas pernae TaxID=3118054 RepID=UPI00324244DF
MRSFCLRHYFVVVVVFFASFKALALGEQTVSEPVQAQLVNVSTDEYRINAPSTLYTGWTTFEFANTGSQAHFVAMYRLVDGKTIDDQLKYVAPVFDPLMQGLRDGSLTKADIGPFFENNVPEWGLQMTWVGGAAMLSPGHSVQATFNIDKAGTYLLECYVKSPDGKWHTLMGMLHQINVIEKTEASAKARMIAVTQDHVLTISDAGIEGPKTLSAGTHTFKVNINSQPAGFMPYDINLAKVDKDTDLQALYYWMDWTNVGGLRAPAPVTFLGGLEHMSAGKHGYITVNLAKGEYLWISEINAAAMNMHFVVE